MRVAQGCAHRARLLIPIEKLPDAHPVRDRRGHGIDLAQRIGYAQVLAPLLYPIEQRLQFLHRSGNGASQPLQQILPQDHEPGNVDGDAGIGIYRFVIVSHTKGIHMAVAGFIVELLQRIDPVPEIGAMGLSQLIQSAGVGCVGHGYETKFVAEEDQV